MSEPRVRTYLAHAELLRILRYDGRTGKFTWRVNRSRTAKAGDEAGSMQPNGTRQITIDGRIYQANRLAWFYQKGAFPGCRLRYANGNPADLRWSNIELEADHYSSTKIAEYHRGRRAYIRKKRAIERDRM